MNVLHIDSPSTRTPASIPSDSGSHRFSTPIAFAAFGFLLLCTTLGQAAETHLPDRSHYSAPHAAIAPVVDGDASDAAWDEARWQTIGYRWLGPEYSAADFQGRFKVVWTGERIHLLAEIVDDILYDAHRDPLVQYWDDDCLEIFIDEDFSGGEHHYNHNAFAYHFSLANQAIDTVFPGYADVYGAEGPLGIVQGADLPVTPSIFNDDFESGNTGAWSSTTP